MRLIRDFFLRFSKYIFFFFEAEAKTAKREVGQGTLVVDKWNGKWEGNRTWRALYARSRVASMKMRVPRRKRSLTNVPGSPRMSMATTSRLSRYTLVPSTSKRTCWTRVSARHVGTRTRIARAHIRLNMPPYSPAGSGHRRLQVSASRSTQLESLE